MFIVSWLGLGCSPQDVESPFTTWTDTVTSSIRAGLPGISAEEGRIYWLHQEGCAPIIEAQGTCFHAHPGSPYGLIDFAGQSGDVATEIPHYALAQHEAVLFVGETPPPSRYWSFNHYQFTRAMPDGTARVTFGSVAQSLHHLRVATRDYLAVVFTANTATADEVAEALKPLLSDAGQPEEAIHIHPMAYRSPDDAAALVDAGVDERSVYSLTMGRGSGADTFAMALRVAGARDPDEPYLDSTTVRAAAFRLTLETPPAYAPFPWPDLPPPDQSDERQSERIGLARDVVANALHARASAQGRQVVSVAVPSAPQKTGASCVRLETTCGANNDDARYHRSNRFFEVPQRTSDASVIVVGVNHRQAAADPQAPQVTYSSLTLNNFTQQVGVHTTFDRELEGSLDAWFTELGEPFPSDFPLTESEHDTLYVVEYARDCSRSAVPHRCVSIPEGPLGVPLSDRFWFTERVYLNQTTGTAPARATVYPPKILGTAIEITEGTADTWVLGGGIDD